MILSAAESSNQLSSEERRSLTKMAISLGCLGVAGVIIGTLTQNPAGSITVGSSMSFLSITCLTVANFPKVQQALGRFHFCGFKPAETEQALLIKN